jgi:hypothetical protein
MLIICAGPRGIEPRPTDLEAVVLPLNYRPVSPNTNKKSPLWRLIALLLRFLEGDVLPQLLGILLKLDLASDELLVLCSPVDFACLLVLELDEIVL